MYLRCTLLLVLVLQAPAVLSQNACIEDTCYYNITAAIQQANESDTITVHGNHEESITVNKSVTIIGNATLLTSVSETVLTITARNVTLRHLSIANFGKGISITNDSTTLHNLNISTHGGQAYSIYVQRANHTVIAHSTITTQNASNNYGIYVFESSNASITNTTISTNGSSDNYAIFLQQDVNNVSIINNDLSAAGPDGNNLVVHIATQVRNVRLEENNISSVNGIFSVPIYLYDNVEQVTIHNNTLTPSVENQNSGVYMEQYLNDIQITSNTMYVRGNQSNGIFIDSARNVHITFNNITLTENESSVKLMSSVSATQNVSIYNNYLYASTPISGSGSATLNTSLQVSENVIGGSVLGGNYYDNATSFSRSCTDSDEDGICDQSLNIEGFTDYLPLAKLPTNRCQQLERNESTFTLNTSVQSEGVCFRILGNSSTLECSAGSINHSYSLPQHGIIIEGENVTVKNCTLYQKNSSAHNIYVAGNGAQLENVTLNNSGSRNHGIVIAANQSRVVRSSITAGSDFSHAILMNSSSATHIINSSLNTIGGREAHALASHDGADNIVTGSYLLTDGSSFWNFGAHLLRGVNETIDNSSITTFSTALFLQSRAYGIHVEESNHTNIHRTHITTNGTTTVNAGINVEQSNNVSIELAHIRTNGTSDNYGIRIYRSRNATVIHTTIQTNGTLGSNIGIFLEEGVNSSLIDNTSITTDGTGFNYGVLLYDNNNRNTLQNLTIQTGGGEASNHGIYFETESRSNIVQSSALTTNTPTSHGIYLNPSVNNTIYDNSVTVYQQDSYALYLKDDSTKTENNTIYNNIFNASQPVRVESGTNSFSIAITSGTNILGGSLLGGNAYDNTSNGASHSRSCPDSNGNGICDLTIQHNSNNTDAAALVIGTRSVSTSLSSSSSSNPAASGGINICTPAWKCTEWTCENGIERRTCSDTNFCQTSEGTPTQQRPCEQATEQQRARHTLFDINSKLLTYNNSHATIAIGLTNFGDPGSVDVQLVYTLLHHNGDILFQEFETVDVETQHEFLKTLNLPSLAPGEYSILIELLYDGQREPARTSLPFVITTKHSSFPFIILILPAGLAAVSAAYTLHHRTPSASYVVCSRAIEEIECAAQVQDHRKAITHFMHLRHYFHQLSEKEQKKIGEEAMRTYHLMHELFQ